MGLPLRRLSREDVRKAFHAGRLFSFWHLDNSRRTGRIMGKTTSSAAAAANRPAACLPYGKLCSVPQPHTGLHAAILSVTVMTR